MDHERHRRLAVATRSRSRDRSDGGDRRGNSRALPEPFHDAECFWQLSASAGLAPGLLKLHPFFWLSEPYDNAYLRRWFAHFAPLVDTAPFNAVQPHYLTDPVISGGVDPLPVRTGWRHGTTADVVLPPLPDVADGRHVDRNIPGTMVGRRGSTPHPLRTPWRDWATVRVLMGSIARF